MGRGRPAAFPRPISTHISGRGGTTPRPIFFAVRALAHLYSAACATAGASAGEEHVHGGDAIAQILESQGVRFVFTLCGGHISPILVACKRRGIRVIDVRHEANAVFAADAVARLTGVPGVAAVTAGPGVTNTITAIKNAQLAQSPLVLIGGATGTVLKGRGALQDIDQMALLRPHVKWAKAVRRVRDLAPALARAFAEARRGIPGPVFVECPVDLLYDEALVRGWYGGRSGKGGSLAERALGFYLKRHVDRMFAGPLPAAAPEPAVITPPRAAAARVARASRRLEGAQRPLLLIGSQAMLEAGRVGDLAAAVERLGVPVYLAGMARGLLGRDHPLQLRHRRSQALKRADLVILAGVPCDFRLDYGRRIPRRTFLVAANRSRAEATRNRRPDILAVGDPGGFIMDLAANTIATDRWSGWRDELRRGDSEREAEIEAQAQASGEFINPLALCAGIESALADNAIVVADGGDFVATASYILRPRAPLSWLDPGVFGTLGVGAGFALGAKLCRPDAEVWIIYGDGAAGYSLAEFDTFVRHSIPIVAVIGNDASWMQIAREQTEMLGDDVATTLRRTDYHRVAEGFGGTGLPLDEEGDIARTLAHAKREAAGGQPVLVNAQIGRSAFRKGSISL